MEAQQREDRRRIKQADFNERMINDLKTGNAVARIVAGKSRDGLQAGSIPPPLPSQLFIPPTPAQMAREGFNVPRSGFAPSELHISADAAFCDI